MKVLFIARATLIVLCASFLMPAQASKLYKWTDANGQSHYSQTPPPDQAVDYRSSDIVGDTREELACLAARLRDFAAIVACWATLACPSGRGRCGTSLPNPAGFMCARPAAGWSGLVRQAQVDTS